MQKFPQFREKRFPPSYVTCCDLALQRLHSYHLRGLALQCNMGLLRSNSVVTAKKAVGQHGNVNQPKKHHQIVISPSFTPICHLTIDEYELTPTCLCVWTCLDGPIEANGFFQAWQ